MSGAGLAWVKQRIEGAFRDARTNVRTHSRKRGSTSTEAELGISLDTATPLPTPLRPLAERAEPIFRVCERRLRHILKRHSAVQCTYISVPTESAEQLYADALRIVKSDL